MFQAKQHYKSVNGHTIDHKPKYGAAPAMVNRELAPLRRMLSLALNAGKVAWIPQIEMLAENNVRESFLKHSDVVGLLKIYQNR